MKPVAALLVLACMTTFASGAPVATQPVGAPDRSTPAAGLAAFMDAIRRGDPDEARRSIAIAPTIDPRVAQDYAEQIVWASRLEWWMERAFGYNEAASTCHDLGVRYYPEADASRMVWRDLDPWPGHPAVQRQLGEYGEGRDHHAQAMELGGDGGWRVLGPGPDAAPVLAARMFNAGRRSARIREVVEAGEGGRYTTAAQVREALARPLRPSTGPATRRPAPETIVAEMDAALARGDADALASLVLVDQDSSRRWFRFEAEEAILDRRAAAAVRKRFPDERADLIIKRLNLRTRGWLVESVRGVAWEADGDVAQQAYRPGSNRRVDPIMRLAWVDGHWRLDYRGLGLRNADVSPARKERLARLRQVLAKLDTCKTVGQVTDLYGRDESLPDAADADDPKRERAEAEERVKQAQAALKQLPPGPAADEARIACAIQLTLSWRELGNADEAAKWIFAEGDLRGAYSRARMRRVIAGDDLAEAALKELGDEDIEFEVGAADAADLAMAMVECSWDVHGDRATAKKPDGKPFDDWMPTMRNIDGVWRVDVTDELRTTARKEADRADAEAKLLADFAKRVRAGEFTSQKHLIDAIHAAGVRGIVLPAAKDDAEDGATTQPSS